MYYKESRKTNIMKRKKIVSSKFVLQYSTSTNFIIQKVIYCSFIYSNPRYIVHVIVP